jgi:phosphatidylserine decarboxylase
MLHFHKEGAKIILITCLISTGIILLADQFIDIFWLQKLVQIIGLFLLVMILQFFRNPKRDLIPNDNVVTAPVDGKVVVIEEVYDEEYFKDKRLQVSIFMSPANVHQNRTPVTGEVVYNQYHKGKYLVAWHPKSSTENERHSVVIRHPKGEILVKQIAGALAKRIVNYLSVGQKVEQCAEMGFIKFGSRVDLLLPLDAKVNVQFNQVVQGGVTVVATLP